MSETLNGHGLPRSGYNNFHASALGGDQVPRDVRPGSGKSTLFPPRRSREAQLSDLDKDEVSRRYEALRQPRRRSAITMRDHDAWVLFPRRRLVGEETMIKPTFQKPAFVERCRFRDRCADPSLRAIVADRPRGHQPPDPRRRATFISKKQFEKFAVRTSRSSLTGQSQGFIRWSHLRHTTDG